MTSARRYAAGIVPGQTPLLVALVLLTLAPSLMGRAGFQLLEDTVARRIFPLHRHGVAGEAEYIATHGEPAPFVHAHCHRLPEKPREHTPSEFAAAGIVLGPLHCGASSAAPALPSTSLTEHPETLLRPAGIDLVPLSPPPQG